MEDEAMTTAEEEVEELIKEYRLSEYKNLIAESDSAHERIQELLKEIEGNFEDLKAIFNDL